MAKKKFKLDKNAIYVVIILVGLYIFSQQKGLMSVTNIYQTQAAQVPLNPEKILYSYNLDFSLTPLQMCAGQSIKGNLNSNMPNGICSVYYDDGVKGFVLFENVNLDGNGHYSESQIITMPSTYTFRIVCCDASNNCKSSNDVKARVFDCNNPNQDSDGDGYTDKIEIGEGTDPFNSDSHPSLPTDQSGIDCNAICVGYASGRGPVDSPGRCNYPEIYVSPCCCFAGQTTFYACCQRNSDLVTFCSRNGCVQGETELYRYSSESECISECYTSQGYYDSGECGNVVQAMFYDTQPTDFTQASCEAHAQSTCGSTGVYVPTNIGFDRNCCWWDCYVHAGD